MLLGQRTGGDWRSCSSSSSKSTKGVGKLEKYDSTITSEKVVMKTEGLDLQGCGKKRNVVRSGDVADD